jgi:hypothetical protein
MSESGGVLFPGVDDDGSQKTVVFPTPGTEKNFYAPNMTDRCGWYELAEQVTEEELTDSGDQITYESLQVYWIDLTHGRVFKENDIITADPTYLIKVEVQVGGTGDWIEKTENSWGTTDGDYGVDYIAGEVKFNSAIGATDKVRATYKYEHGYLFTVVPSENKMLRVLYAEVQYTQDMGFTTDIIFEYEAEVAPNNWVKVGGFAFKRLWNFYEESIGPYPVIPAHGGEWVVEEITGITAIQDALNHNGDEILSTHYTGTEWIAIIKKMTGDRAIKSPVITVPFTYRFYKELGPGTGYTNLRMLMKLNGDIPLTGQYGNITFYCESLDLT